MTILKFIKTEKCPICGCSVVVKEEILVDYDDRTIKQRHGSREETRQFQCNYSIKYEPNFSKVTKYWSCHNSKEYMEHKKLEDQFDVDEKELKVKYKELGLTGYKVQ